MPEQELPTNADVSLETRYEPPSGFSLDRSDPIDFIDQQSLRGIRCLGG